MQEKKYDVIVVGKGQTFTDIQPLANRIDALLQRGGTQGVAMQGSTAINGSQRESSIQQAEIVENVRYNHLGGLYRFFLSP